jgi:hypothetical protein
MNQAVPLLNFMDAISRERLQQGAKPQKAIDFLMLDAAAIAHAHFFSTRDALCAKADSPASAISGFYQTTQRLIARFKPVRVIVPARSFIKATRVAGNDSIPSCGGKSV